MALWRCPHCGTPQPVAARCWVCRRSSTSCGTCRHFRESVAARIGYCGLDRDRRPLAGSEIRACWDGAPIVVDDEPTAPVVAVEPLQPGATFMSGFVPVEPVFDAGAVAPPAPAPVPAPIPGEAASQPGPVLAPAADGLLWADLDA